MNVPSLPFSPDFGEVLFKEDDVVPPNREDDLYDQDAYDLRLVGDKSSNRRAVLVVIVNVAFAFHDGDEDEYVKAVKRVAQKKFSNQADRNKYIKTQTQAKNIDQWKKFRQNERLDFVKDFKAAIKSVWNYKFPIVRTSQHTDLVDEIGVWFKINNVGSKGLWDEVINYFAEEYWEVEVTKSKGFPVSSVNHHSGNAVLDSQDNKPCKKTHGQKQRGAVHEFGHMLGLYDEYKSSSWKNDVSSVMHNGEQVRPRHYAMLADWVSKQYRKLATGAAFKVKDGDRFWDMNNSKLNSR